MKKLTLTSLLVGAALFTTLGTTTLSAGMKCGAGKCGDSTSKPVAKSGANKMAGKCGANKKKASTKCGAKHMKASNGKCGTEKKAEKKAMKKAGKCGKGKCGGK